jgi:hypothetical protein
MFLIGTGSQIEVLLGSSVVSNSLPVVASYADNTATTFTPGAQQTTVNGTTPVIVVSGTAASSQRTINFINIYNADVAAVTASFQISGSSTNLLTKTILQPSSTMQFTPEGGWTVFGAGGSTLIGGPRSEFGPTLKTISWKTSFGVARAMGPAGTALAVFIGNADRSDFVSCSVRFRVTALSTNTAYSEIALLTGDHIVDQTPSLTPRGYADVTSYVTGGTTGLASASFSISNVKMGDSLYLGIIVSGSTNAQFRATNTVDFSEGYQYISAANTLRFSDVLHKQLMFTIDGSNVLYMAAQLS